VRYVPGLLLDETLIDGKSGEKSEIEAGKGYDKGGDADKRFQPYLLSHDRPQYRYPIAQLQRQFFQLSENRKYKMHFCPHYMLPYKSNSQSIDNEKI
jgi:hypothetical protein